MWEEFPRFQRQVGSAIRVDLEGADYDKSSYGTEEGIVVRPYYRQDDLPGTTGQVRFTANGAPQPSMKFPRMRFAATRARAGSDRCAGDWVRSCRLYRKAKHICVRHRRELLFRDSQTSRRPAIVGANFPRTHDNLVPHIAG